MDPDAGLCSACGYDLTGLPDIGNCPECGQTYNRHSREGVSRRREEEGVRIQSALPVGCGGVIAGVGMAAAGILWASGYASSGLFWSVAAFAVIVVLASLTQSLGSEAR